VTGVPSTVQRAGIIAAGRGDRLRQATDSLKPLVPVAGRPLIDHVLTSIAETSPGEVVIIVNDGSLAVKDYIDRRRWPFAVRWIVETTPSSMHSFLRVLETIAQDDDEGPFLISTVDTIAAPGAFASFVAASRDLQGDATLALAPPGDDEKPLLVRLTPGTSRIEAMGDEIRLKPDPTSANAGAVRGVRLQPDLWATAGYYAVRPSVLREADRARSDKLPALRTFFTHLLKNGYRLNGVPVAGAVDVDRPGDVEAAEAFLKQAGA
jgi:NDP-sugar pyrophosphorylase family protein